VRIRATGNTSARGSQEEGKTVSLEMWRMEARKRIQLLVIGDG
jgi:hypothetical protein